MGTSEYQATIIDHHAGIDLTILDEGEEFKGEPSMAATKAPSAELVPMPEPVRVDLVAIPKSTLVDPTIMPRPFSVEGITAPFEDATTIADPMEKVIDQFL